MIAPSDWERLQRRLVHQAPLSRAAAPLGRLAAGHPGSLFVTVATSTPPPPDREDAHEDKRVCVWGEGWVGGWAEVRQRRRLSADKHPPPTGLLWRQDRLKARLDASEDVADLTNFSLIVLGYL